MGGEVAHLNPSGATNTPRSQDRIRTCNRKSTLSRCVTSYLSTSVTLYSASTNSATWLFSRLSEMSIRFNLSVDLPSTYIQITVVDILSIILCLSSVYNLCVSLTHQSLGCQLCCQDRIRTCNHPHSCVDTLFYLKWGLDIPHCSFSVSTIPPPDYLITSFLYFHRYHTKK